jgi:hypothetical protein
MALTRFLTYHSCSTGGLSLTLIRPLESRTFIMTSVKEIDLVSEYEKAKTHVALLESILAIKKQKDEQQLSFSKSQAEVESLSRNCQAAKTELDNLKANFTKDEEEHRAKAEEWKAKNSNSQRIIFNADAASNDSSENEEDLKGSAQLAEENAGLFRQKLVLREFSSKIKGKAQDIASLESSLSKKEELQSVLENQLKKSTDDFYKGREEYQQKPGTHYKGDCNYVIIVDACGLITMQVVPSADTITFRGQSGQDSLTLMTINRSASS